MDRGGNGDVAVTTPAGQVCAVLQPAVAEAARLAGAGRVGLVDVTGGRPGTEANLHLDDVLTTYAGQGSLGRAGASVRLRSRVVGARGVPATPVPAIVAREAVAVERDLGAGLAAALVRVPDDALAVVLTTWALSRLRPERRPAFLPALEQSAGGRPVAWVSVEGVGVAPAVPTLGDRPASGHSLVGLHLVGAAGPPRVLGRCWSRGAVLSWS
ncbi:hypothetical protein SAMN04488544_1617 [Microlunatus sagamiharensis]|uniref:Uncharacterized protein n=1 Tax=Microlunatus sagamiharensis TaxID=546874 RepID=A0A1H2M9T7_9ACTN|nr:hypothetical protein SAMN04488544_1617 [Microlunatus sagamiharensis]